MLAQKCRHLISKISADISRKSHKCTDIFKEYRHILRYRWQKQGRTSAANFREILAVPLLFGLVKIGQIWKSLAQTVRFLILNFNLLHFSMTYGYFYKKRPFWAKIDFGTTSSSTKSTQNPTWSCKLNHFVPIASSIWLV